MNYSLSKFAFHAIVGFYSLLWISQQSVAQNPIGSIDSFASATGQSATYSGSQQISPTITDEEHDSKSDVILDSVGQWSLSTSVSSSTPRHNSSASNSTSINVGDGQVIVTVSSSASLDAQGIVIDPIRDTISAAGLVNGTSNGHFNLALDARDGVWKGVYATFVRGSRTDTAINGSMTFTHPTAQTETVEFPSTPVSGLIPESPQRTSISIQGGVNTILNGGAPLFIPSSSSSSLEVTLVVLLGQGELPGENLENPIRPILPPVFRPTLVEDTLLQHLDEPPTSERPAQIAGVNLTTPVNVPVIAGGYGNSQTVWIDPDLAIGYGYSLDGTNRFLTYQIPEALPQGDDSFEIHHNGITYDLAAGEVFDFTTIDPQGVDSFLLLGIDETELIDVDGQSHPPFVYGATFLQPGLAQVTTFALTQVPEPTSLLLLLLSTSLMASRRDDALLMPRRWCK